MDWRTAIGWGTVTGSDRAGEGDRMEAERGMQSSGSSMIEAGVDMIANA